MIQGGLNTSPSVNVTMFGCHVMTFRASPGVHQGECWKSSAPVEPRADSGRALKRRDTESADKVGFLVPYDVRNQRSQSKSLTLLRTPGILRGSPPDASTSNWLMCLRTGKRNRNPSKAHPR